MPNLPTLTPAEIEAELKTCEIDILMDLESDYALNAARAIRLARENEELRAKVAAAQLIATMLARALDFIGAHSKEDAEVKFNALEYYYNYKKEL